MHERSLLLAMLRQVNRISAENNHADVEEIVVEAGTLSGVEPDLLRAAFQELHSQYLHTKLTIRVIPVTARCQSCGQVWNMEQFKSECPACHSPKVQITGGDAFRLLHVTLKDR